MLVLIICMEEKQMFLDNQDDFDVKIFNYGK